MAVDGKDKYSKGDLGREGKVWRAVLEGPEEVVFQVLRQVDRGVQRGLPVSSPDIWAGKSAGRNGSVGSRRLVRQEVSRVFNP